MPTALLTIMLTTKLTAHESLQLAADNALANRSVLDKSRDNHGRRLNEGAAREFSQLIEGFADSAASAFGLTPAPGKGTVFNEVPLFAQQPRPATLAANNPPTPIKPKKKQQKER